MSPLAPQRLLDAAQRLAAAFGASEPAGAARALDDEALLRVLRDVAVAQKALQLIGACVTAEVDRRSARELGYDGLAQRTGHRTGTDLVQSVTGQTRADVRRAAAVGLDVASASAGGGDPDPAGDPRAEVAGRRSPWFAPLTVALGRGTLSREQFDAIRRGLGEPPVDRYPELDPAFLPAAWGQAATRLIAEAGDRGVEDLAADARLARDTLDPVGVQLRFDERFDRRSLRVWVDKDGQHHGHLVFDDDAAVWVRTILNAALRPRRGPRFVAAEQRRVADDEAGGDARSTEQLQYDTLLAVMRTGAAADPRQAFGDRQPGVRIVVPAESLETGSDAGPPAGTAYAEETRQALPASIAERYVCEAGTKTVWTDRSGRPLDVGRELRLFTKRQRDALAVRDGGCRWCGAEPSRCEAHHVRHWRAHGGGTDLADGVLLCRNCHLRLHNQGWLVERRGSTYWLHPPDRSAPRELRPRSLLRYRGVGRA